VVVRDAPRTTADSPFPALPSAPTLGVSVSPALSSPRTPPGPALDKPTLCPVCDTPSTRVCSTCDQYFCSAHIYSCAVCATECCGACLDSHLADGHWSDSDTAAELDAQHSPGRQPHRRSGHSSDVSSRLASAAELDAQHSPGRQLHRRCGHSSDVSTRLASAAELDAQHSTGRQPHRRCGHSSDVSSRLASTAEQTNTQRRAATNRLRHNLTSAFQQLLTQLFPRLTLIHGASL
jgi:hypothetical protein